MTYNEAESRYFLASPQSNDCFCSISACPVKFAEQFSWGPSASICGQIIS